MDNNKDMLSIEKLETELNKIIKKDFDNIKLNRKLNEKFAQKGFNPSRVNKIMNEEIYINQLNDFEKICLAYGCNEFIKEEQSKKNKTKPEEAKGNKYLEPELYFSDKVIRSYENYMSEYEKVNFVELHNFQMKNDYEYYGLISYKQIFDMMSNNLLTYNIDIQRSPTYKKIGNITIPMPTVDNNTVASIEEAILKNEFEDTQIVLTLLTKDNGKFPKFAFEEKFENIGDIIIDEPLIINDGMHRILSLCNAFAKHYQEKKEYLEGSISVRLVICDKSRAKKITAQSFKKALTNVSWLKAIDGSDVNKFVDKFVGCSKTLKDEVAMTYEEAKALNKLTYKTLIIDLVNKLKIEVNDKGVVLSKSKKMAEYLDTLIDLLKDNEAGNNIYELNMWVAYIWFAYKMSNEKEEDIELYQKMIDKVLAMTTTDKKNLKLTLKNYSMDNIINYFKDVFEVK